MLFKRVVDDQLYAATGGDRVQVDGGTHDLVIVTTVNNSVYAFDANDAEATTPIWHVNFGTPPHAQRELRLPGHQWADGNHWEPVIDKARGVLYVVALTQVRDDAAGLGAGYTQRLHELDIASGADLPRARWLSRRTASTP